MESLKITAGMGDLTAYETLVSAGADEIFCGYVPFSWKEKYDNILPLNRREVLFNHVQIGSPEDMRILAKKMKKYGVPVTVTFNSLYYIPEQLPLIAAMIQELRTLGFQDYIIADLNLIRYLAEHNISCRIHVSGEIGEWNSYVSRLLLEDLSNENTRITRIIFHRKTDFSDMRKCIETGKALNPDLEFEAFCMNEKCHYTGGYCNSLHCDELVHLCRLEYRLSPVSKTLSERAFLTEENETNEIDLYTSADPVPGESGCGLCAIAQLADIGITHLKVVGRGLSPIDVSRDIRAVKNVLLSADTDLYRSNCSGNCYYLWGTRGRFHW